MEEKRLVPKRRFREFQNEEDWKQSRMKEVVNIYDGTHQTPKYTKSGVMFLSVENIHSLKSNKYISYEDFERDFKIFPEMGDILMTRIGDIGTANVVESDDNKAYYVTLALLKKRGLNPYFLKESIHSVSIRKELWHRTLHIAFPKKINMDEIGKVLINYPGSLEQQKIGQFFKILDERIANQERKIAKVKALKSAYLTEMFPQKGETVPKRRFKGFEDEWETKRLGEISFINTGESDVKDSVSDGEYPFFVRSKNIENSDTYTYDGEAILIPGEGKLGEIYHYYNGKFNYHQRVYKISDFDENVDGKFIYYIMHTTFKQHALKHTVKATVDSLRLPTLTSYKFCLPNKKEQQKIGSFFKNLDNQIEMEEKKLDKLQKMKEAYLEEMFV